MDFGKLFKHYDRDNSGQLDEEEESESEEEVADPEALEEEEEYDAAGYTLSLIHI